MRFIKIYIKRITYEVASLIDGVDFSGVNYLLISNALYSLSIFTIFAMLERSNNSEAVFFLTAIQQSSQVLMIILFYGIQFECKEDLKVISVGPLIVGILLISFFNIYAAILLAMIARLGFSKFSRSESVFRYKLFLVVVALGLTHSKTGAFVEINFVFYAILVCFCVQLLFKHSQFEVFRLKGLPNVKFTNICKRCLLDTVILIPPIVINLVFFWYATNEDYLRLQTLFYVLAASGFFHAIIERLVFNQRKDALSDGLSAKFLLLMGLVLCLITVFVASWFSVGPMGFVFLIFCSMYGIFFSHWLSQGRMRLSSSQLLRVSIYQAVVFVIVFTAALIFGDTSLTATVVWVLVHAILQPLGLISGLFPERRLLQKLGSFIRGGSA